MTTTLADICTRVMILAFLLAAGAPAPAQQQRTEDYGAALSLMWGTLYRDGGRTLYCDLQFGRNRGERINVEHVMPMSWAAYALRCGRRDECRRSSPAFNHIEADLHNMWPSLVEVNRARRSYPFGVVHGEQRIVSGCDFEIDERARIAEPRPLARGEIARSMFYMHAAYGIPIRSRLALLLKRWNHQDPVSDEERRRNALIERLQGSRNPFIDDPSRADALAF